MDIRKKLSNILKNFFRHLFQLILKVISILMINLCKIETKGLDSESQVVLFFRVGAQILAQGFELMLLVLLDHVPVENVQARIHKGRGLLTLLEVALGINGFRRLEKTISA